MEIAKVAGTALPYGQVMVKQCGFEPCAPGHQFGPAVRDHYLIHYVASGKGTFFSDQGEFALEAGQGFIIFPGEITTYRADMENPWLYGWVGYQGHDAAALTRHIGLTREQPIFSAGPPETIFRMLTTMTEDVSTLRMGNMAALGGLYRILSLIAQHRLLPGQDPHRQYYEKARWFMEGNYDRPIRITDIAAFVGLSRSQLFRVFLEVCGHSPKESLTQLRMQKALALVEAGELRQEEMAASLGLLSGAQFARLFRNRFGESPNKWKKRGKSVPV